MVSHSDIPAAPDPPKPLKGVGIVVAQRNKDGSQTTLGVVFSPNTEKLKDLLIAIHGQSVTVNMADIRGGSVTLDR